MKDNIYVQATIIVLLLAYGLYTFVKVLKVFLKHVQLKKEYIQKHKGRYTYQQDFYIWAVVYSIVTVLGFVTAVTEAMEQDYMMAAGFFFMGCFCATFVMDSIMKRQAFFDEDGFFFELKHYRYRSVARLEPRKGLIKSYDLFLISQDSIRISKAMGDMLEEKRKEYRKNKKEK